MLLADHRNYTHAADRAWFQYAIYAQILALSHAFNSSRFDNKMSKKVSHTYSYTGGGALARWRARRGIRETRRRVLRASGVCARSAVCTFYRRRCRQHLLRIRVFDVQ